MNDKASKIEALIFILEQVLARISDVSVMEWTWYDSPAELRADILSFISKLQTGNTACLDDLKLHFAPTCTFQQHALQNDWIRDYLQLSVEFDKLYNGLKALRQP